MAHLAALPFQHLDEVRLPERDRGTTAGENRLKVSTTVRIRATLAPS